MIGLFVLSLFLDWNGVSKPLFIFTALPTVYTLLTLQVYNPYRKWVGVHTGRYTGSCVLNNHDT